MDIRPRRSVLYMPGANARALEKARALPADALILDLEDAVAPEAKAEARERVAEAVTSGAIGPREVVIRVNAIDTPWGMPIWRRRSRPAPMRSWSPRCRAPAISSRPPRSCRPGRRRPDPAVGDDGDA
jgi:citrate lyase subunit beta / citryl-CoA lyase